MTTTSKKVVLITGANSGLGFQCGLALAKLPNFHVILAGRSQKRIDDAVHSVKAQAAPSSVVEGAIVDLASLADVRRFAHALVDRDLQFFSIVCNAGVQLSQKTTTADGFESTVGVNHTAHFLLLQLLRDRTKRIVMMSSETHDPTEVKSLQPLDMSDVRALARGLEPYDTMQVYATSKLCNLLFTKEFARRFPDGPEILAYTPGLTPDTGLFREHNAVARFLLKHVVGFFYRWSGGRTSTAAFSGGYMARIAGADAWADHGWARGDYIRVDEVWPASAQACDPALGKALWEATEEWVTPFLH